MENSFRALIQLPEIRRVALSPKSEWFACVVSRKGDARLPGSIKYTRMQALLKAAKPGYGFQGFETLFSLAKY
jgi:hypothetical protein